MKFKSLSAGKAAFARRKRKVTRMVFGSNWTQDEMQEFHDKWDASLRTNPCALIMLPAGKQPPSFIQRKP
jgi:hypothetical protein